MRKSLLNRLFFLVLLALSVSAFAQADQTKNIIEPRVPVQPFKQWMGNNGYCGETSLIQAGLNHGQWMSQYNARLICGTGLSQSGPDGFCAAHDGNPNYNSQMLLENQRPGLDSTFASAATCLQNARLQFQTFDYKSQPRGLEGYRRYMSWVKAQVIAGHQVTVGIFVRGGSDPQYDHEVTITKIRTHHSPIDSAYYGDDVLYFDDHLVDGVWIKKGYTFRSLAATRDSANLAFRHYSILIPGMDPIESAAGGDGTSVNAPIQSADYAFAVSGPADDDHENRPVKLTIVASSTQGRTNSVDGFFGYNFESPGIANNACTNDPPQSQMQISLQAEVSGLEPGAIYNLYEYDFPKVTGVGAAAGLAVPTRRFNAQAHLATHVTQFVAKSASFVQTVQKSSDEIVVFRCVPAGAP